MNEAGGNPNYFYKQKMNRIFEKNPQEWRKYTLLHINEVTKYPSRDWDFSKIQFSCLFEINWINIFPDAKWDLDFSYLSTKTNLEIHWILEYPDAAWDYRTLSIHPKFTIAWVDYLPHKPWNFRIMHLYFDRNEPMLRLRDPKSHTNCLADLTYRENFFSIDWIDKCPNKPWNFEEFHKFNNLNAFWLESYLEKPWNFEEMYKNENFQLSWVKKLPEQPWNLDFAKLSSAPNFMISWVEEYPDKNWNYQILSHRLDFNIKWLDRFPEKPWDYYHIIRESIPESEIWLLENINFFKKMDTIEIQKYFMVRKYTSGVIYKLYPGLFYQIDQTLELQDLSGNIFFLKNWFLQKNILRYAKQELPMLGDFDINIDRQGIDENNDSDSDSEDFMFASQTPSPKFKSHLFQNPKGPQGMIVYLD